MRALIRKSKRETARDTIRMFSFEKISSFVQVRVISVAVTGFMQQVGGKKNYGVINGYFVRNWWQAASLSRSIIIYLNCLSQ